MVKRFQNKLAESKIALPSMTFITLTVVFLKEFFSQKTVRFTADFWLQLALLTTATLLFAFINTRHSLIRTYSRMVSSTFLALLCAAVFMLGDLRFGIVSAAFVIAYAILFETFQQKATQGHYYYAFLSIGIASLFFHQIILFLPFLWIGALVNLLSMTWKSFLASLLGIFTPYWFLTVYFFYRQDFSFFSEYINIGVPFQFYILDDSQKAFFCFMMLLFATGTIHFLRKNYLDKMKIRQFFYLFITLSIVALSLIVVWPHLYIPLMSIAIVNVSPLVAHFVTLTNTRSTNLLFILILLLTTAFTAYTLLYI